MKEKKKIISLSTRGKEKNMQFNHGLAWEVETKKASLSRASEHQVYFRVQENKKMEKRS